MSVLCKTSVSLLLLRDFPGFPWFPFSIFFWTKSVFVMYWAVIHSSTDACSKLGDGCCMYLRLWWASFSKVGNLSRVLNRHQKSMEGILEVGSGGQCPPGGQPHNPATWFHPTTTVVSPEPFPHQSRALWSLWKDMVSYRHWSVLLWWDPKRCPTSSNPALLRSWTVVVGGLSQLHSADDAAIAWLTNYRS